MDNNNQSNLFLRIWRTRGMGQVITVTCGLIVLCIVFGSINNRFLGADNVMNLLRQIAPYVIVGIGQSYVLMTGNIDLSIGSVLGMSMMISATLMSKGMAVIPAICITLAAALATGMVNGILVSKCSLPPFIATLGTMTIARGVAQMVNGNRNTDMIGEHALGFSNFFYYGNFLGLFNGIWIALALFLVFNFVLSSTTTGRHLYAVGSNVEAAKMSGVSVSKTTITAYLVSSFCACTVGLMQCAQGRVGTMDAGTSFEMYAVAASVIGGVSTLGGQGILLGTVVGAAVWGVMNNGLSLVGAPVALRNIIIGVIVIISVLSDVLVRRRKS